MALLPDSDEPPLLGLAMIVKDESAGLAATLQSFRPFIDEYVILDTGSTDGTQDIIRKELEYVPGELIEEPFVDFATSRNRALDLFGERCPFVIMPDADDDLAGGITLRSRLLAHGSLPASPEAYLVNVRRGSDSYYLPLVMRTSARWRYTGRVHEYLSKPGAPPASVKLADVSVVRKCGDYNRARWRRDAELLSADVLEDPKNARAWFYLGQTQACLSELAEVEADKAYAKRLALGGWHDETFETMLRRARIAKRTKPWATVLQMFLDAHAFDPTRAEPLYEIAEYYHEQDNHALAFLFARRAAELPEPPSTLFVDLDVYRSKAADVTAIHGFYMPDPAAKAAGERAAMDAVIFCPDNQRMRMNLAFYAKSAAALWPRVKMGAIGYADHQTPWVAMNPSITWDKRAGWVCNVRLTNYQLVNGAYLVVDEDGSKHEISVEHPVQSRNVLVELDDNLVIRARFEIRDNAHRERAAFPVHGYEDCRLFFWRGKPWLLATVADLTEAGMREQCLLGMDGPGDLIACTPLRGPWSSLHQKNWMPLVTAGDQLSLVYSIAPFRAYSIDEIAKHQREDGDAAPFGRLRGGSQLVEIRRKTGHGWLCLVHEVAIGGKEGRERTYLHRWVLVDRERMRPHKISEPFYFERRGIEFCCGLGYDGKRLVASYSVGDASANLAVFDPDEVLESLVENREVP